MVHEIDDASLGRCVRVPEARRRRNQNDPAEPLALVHTAMGNRPISPKRRTVHQGPREKTRRPGPSGGEGGGYPQDPDRRDTGKDPRGLPPSPPASQGTIQAQPRFAKTNCELYPILDNWPRSENEPRVESRHSIGPRPNFGSGLAFARRKPRELRGRNRWTGFRFAGMCRSGMQPATIRSRPRTPIIRARMADHRRPGAFRAGGSDVFRRQEQQRWRLTCSISAVEWPW
jgi:hypothetical protein